MKSPARLLLLLTAALFVAALIELGALSVAFEKLGLSARSAYLLFLVTLAGSTLNLPLFTLKTSGPAPSQPLPDRVPQGPASPPPAGNGRMLVTANVGGCVTPVAFTIYLLAYDPVDPAHLAVIVGIVACVAYLTSFSVAGIGIVIPALVAPATSALVATMLKPEHAAVLAYAGGTMGVLIGADLLRLKDLRSTPAPVASIGGGGSFDGIFLTGVIAVLLT